MEEGSLAAAPIWCGDFTDLRGEQFRGVVDCVVAGFPCQDLSIAGRRAGLDGKPHASSASETESFRCKRQQRLSCLLGEPEQGGQHD